MARWLRRRGARAVGVCFLHSYANPAHELRMRDILAHRPFPLIGLAWAIALALLGVLIACMIFYRIYRHAVRTGLIARYSAETV